MTTPAVGSPGRAGAVRGRWRWLRLVVPVAVAMLLLVVTAVAYSVQQPDQEDPAYLSPTSAAPTGADRLAGLLASRGTAVRRVTSGSQALIAAAERKTGQAVLFVPTPSLVHPFYLRMIKLLPAGVQVVLVAPSATTLANGLVPATASTGRLATRAALPGCSYAPAAHAGSAGVFRLSYRAPTPLVSCYDGALTSVSKGAATVTMVGSDEPFRNDRIGEHHNAALATELLGAAPLVIWLDLHRAEPRPGYLDGPSAPADEPAAPPSLGPGGSPDPDFQIPVTDPADPADDNDSGKRRRDGDADGGDGSNPLWRVLPPWALASAALLALVAVLFAVARARRLGAPVSEPLPITVRSTETVTGRGRLYQRARARGPAAATLRTAAVDRLVHLLDLPRGGTPQSMVAAVAAHTGWPAGTVARLLTGDDPADDAELVQVATGLEALVAAAASPAASPVAEAAASPAAEAEAAAAPAADAATGQQQDSSVRGVADGPEGVAR